jgi:sterol 3beta-glucosyltransferase
MAPPAPAERAQTHLPAATRKRFALLTYGSRGDVEPFVALGVGLRRAGHTVRLAAPRPYARLVLDHDLDFVPIESDPEQLTLAMTDRAGLSWPRMIGRMIQHVLPVAASAFRSTMEAADGADLIVHSFMMTDAGHTLARQQRIPEVSAQLFPVFLPTAAFPGVAAPDLPLGPLYRLATHWLNTAIFKYGGRWLYRRVRSENPDLPALEPWPFDGPSAGGLPILFAYSPRVLPRPRAWPENAAVTGYWALPVPDGWNPPEDLARFLDEGPPPVYFGVGSMRTERMKELTRRAVEAISMTGQRGILGVPAGSTEDLPRDGFMVVEAIPHAWLFPRMGLVIHHGGAGTTGAALRAGVPSVATPFTADQAFWSRRVRRLGVGPSPVPAHQLTAAEIAGMIDNVLTDGEMARRAADLGRVIQGEDGVGTALAAIEPLLG